ncbi:MAG: PDZ domain-containing protein [Phycisphaerales bacterium]|nr:PDZ domain-containing protein [Phycisphaerales bacterium]
MTQIKTVRRSVPVFAAALALAAGTLVSAPALVGQADANQSSRQSRTQTDAWTNWSESVWGAARQGDAKKFRDLIAHAPDALDPAISETIEAYKAALQKQEKSRNEQRESSLKDLEKRFTPGATPVDLSHALVALTHLTEIAEDRDRELRKDRSRELIRSAERAAREAERNGEWLLAHELFYRLETLLDPDAKYADDVRRTAGRLAMIQFYAPEAMWKLRNQRRLMEDEDGLPAYNPTADDFRERLRGITTRATLTALQSAARQHVERDMQTTPREMILAGLSAMETMMTTEELREVFPGMRDKNAYTRLLDRLRGEAERVRNANSIGTGEFDTVVHRVLSSNDGRVLPEAAILHEFGNGAMGHFASAAFDDHTGVIWPDQIRRFERTTEGNFVGVGISIQLDERQNIKVVTPLEGTPAHRAGIRPDDVIKFVDGESTAGMSLNQAVDIITGPEGRTVLLGVERTVKDPDATEDGTRVKLVEIPIVRERIDIRTVSGWRRNGVGEFDWDWFVDPDRKIGYVRMTQFTKTTTRDFDRAFEDMKSQGVAGLILDMRFNPGGLLEEAVSMSEFFLPRGARVVSARDHMNRSRDVRNARGLRSVGDIPVVIIVNEGSASASEIVAGAVQDHAGNGNIRALVVGARTFGKGSVQNVWQIPGSAMAMKLTTQYYELPGGRLIHKRPGDKTWGVDPDMPVFMLPSQVSEALLKRREADIVPGIEGDFDLSEMLDPSMLIDDGVDLQLHTALLLLQSQTRPPALTTKDPR